MRKRLAIAMGLSLTAALLAVAAGPLLALRSLRDGLAGRQPDVVARRIDFPALRANIRAAVHDRIERDNDGTLLEPLGNFFGKTLADEAIESRLTPDGLIDLACEKGGTGAAAGNGEACELGGELRSVRYLSASRFRVDIRRADGMGSALILARSGNGIGWNDWRLVDALETGKRS